MLDALIRFSLRHRPLVLAAALLVLVAGWQSTRDLPLEVLPDLTKPTVTVLTECPGLSPEEVETQVTRPIEAALLGTAGIDRLRSNSDSGLSLVFAEFAWGSDLIRARQAVQERLQAAVRQLPSGVTPGLTPVSSLMGEILLVGLHSTDEKIAPADLRTIADTTVRRRLQSIPGVADVLAIGGGVQQIHVMPDPRRVAAHQLTFKEIQEAVSRTGGNTTSGYLTVNSRELVVRNVGLTTDLAELRRAVVKIEGDHVILLGDIARVEDGIQPMRGDASVNGTPGVILSVDKAPGFDTLQLTAEVERALEELRSSLPTGTEATILFRQGDFIERSIANLREVVRDGTIIVAVILFLFLLNLRTTLITLAAIPLSFAITLLVFRWLGVSVNTMTLGGLAVAIGMVVDDAIVDVENVFRRLRENARLANPKPVLEVVAQASSEVRNSIFYATVLVVLVFLPLLGLQGLEGQLFSPIAIATTVSIAASFLVSLTVIPVLCSLLLRPRGEKVQDSFLVRGMKTLVAHTALPLALKRPFAVLVPVAAALAAAAALYPMMGKDFLPAFNEGSATVSLVSMPGTSLYASNQIGEVAVRLLQRIPEIKSIGRRTGRAERDDHVVPVSVSEFDIEFHPGGRPRAEVLAEIRRQLGTIPGTFVNVGAPIAHRLAHMLSGASAKVAVKVFGADLDALRDAGEQIAEIARGLPGFTDVMLEPQVPVPQVVVDVDRERALAYGMHVATLNEQVSGLIGGRTVAHLQQGEQPIDMVVRLPTEWWDTPEELAMLPIVTPTGQTVPLRVVADVREGQGPNVINRENAQRRVVVLANTTERDLQSLVQRLESEVREKVKLPEGAFVRFEGEYLAQQSATQRIFALFAAVVVVLALMLYSYFRSGMLAAQVLLNIPLALLGGLVLTWWLVDNISIATLVGFIAVGGVAARNGIMMLSHYLHLMKHEGEGFTRAMVVRGTLERLVPVLMTALCAGIALLPLVFAAGEPGKELLHPVAVVIVGGLLSSTLLDLLVTPAVFYHFGRRAAEQALRRGASAAH